MIPSYSQEYEGILFDTHLKKNQKTLYRYTCFA